MGKFENYTAKLSKGSIFRFFNTKKIPGNERGCYCNFGEWFNKLETDDLISINSGRNFLKVIDKETLEHGLMEVGLQGDTGRMTPHYRSEDSFFVSPQFIPFRKLRKQSDLPKELDREISEKRSNKSQEKKSQENILHAGLIETGQKLLHLPIDRREIHSPILVNSPQDLTFNQKPEYHMRKESSEKDESFSDYSAARSSSPRLEQSRSHLTRKEKVSLWLRYQSGQ
jgi:hypothetical protein